MENRCIDYEAGLKSLAGKEAVYNRLLKGFLQNYEHLKIDINSSDSLRDVHTIKGLSANLGAMKLSAVSRELEINRTEESLEEFYRCLNEVLEEIRSRG